MLPKPSNSLKNHAIYTHFPQPKPEAVNSKSPQRPHIFSEPFWQRTSAWPASSAEVSPAQTPAFYEVSALRTLGFLGFLGLGFRASGFRTSAIQGGLRVRTSSSRTHSSLGVRHSEGSLLRTIETSKRGSRAVGAEPRPRKAA